METFLYWLNIVFLGLAALSFFRSLYMWKLKAIIINGIVLSFFTYLQFFYRG
jgi:hypothetical protein